MWDVSYPLPTHQQERRAANVRSRKEALVAHDQAQAARSAPRHLCSRTRKLCCAGSQTDQKICTTRTASKGSNISHDSLFKITKPARKQATSPDSHRRTPVSRLIPLSQSESKQNLDKYHFDIQEQRSCRSQRVRSTGSRCDRVSIGT